MKNFSHHPKNIISGIEYISQKNEEIDKNLNDSQEIISDDLTTIQGMNYLVSVGLLTQQRRDEILG